MKFMGSRQAVELPPIKLIYVQHNIYRRKCSCGCCTEESFPQGASAPVSYGPSVEGLVGCLHARQFIPYARMQEFFTDVLGLPLSAGSLFIIIQRLATKAKLGYERIRQQLEHTDSGGSDEASAKVNGQKHWMWAWQSALLT